MKLSTLKTFENCRFSKAAAVAMAKNHIEHGLLMKKTYGKFIKDGEPSTEDNPIQACSVGCMGGSGKHGAFPGFFGISEAVAYLMDTLFESCPKQEEANEFHLAVWEAMPEGVSPDLLVAKFLEQMLIDPECGAFGRSADSDRHLTVVSGLFADYKFATVEQFTAAADAARADAARAAYAARAAADAAARAAYAAYAAYAAQRQLFLKVLKGEV